jgi:hypothetical protein
LAVVTALSTVGWLGRFAVEIDGAEAGLVKGAISVFNSRFFFCFGSGAIIMEKMRIRL